VTFRRASGIIAAVDRRQQITRSIGSAFRQEAPTRRAQAAGAALITLPALAHPLPLGPGVHLGLELLAVVLAFAGCLLVVGGVTPRLLPTDPAPARARQIRLGLAVLTGLLALGAVLALLVAATDGWTEHLPGAVLLALAAGALTLTSPRARAKPPA
jgi:hypothetical protein